MMKKATNRLIAFLMVLVMLLDAAPLAVLAEDLGDNGQIIAEAPVSGQVEAAGEDSEKSLANDETKGKQFGVKKKVAHELTEGEYEVHDIPDSKLNELKEKYLENWKPNEANPSEASDGQAAAQALTIEPPKASFSKLRMSRTAVSSTNTDSASTAKGSAAVSAQDNEPQQAQGLVAYDIELVKDKASAAEEYQVTIPVDNVDMLDGHRNADSGKTLKILNVSYRLIHIHTDENGDSTETTIDGDNVNVNYTPDGKITDFSFTVDSFSTFVLVYTVDFVYIEKKAEISIDLGNFQANSNELGQLLYKNSKGLEELAVSDILDFAQDYLQDENVCGVVYTVSLQNGTALSDFDQNFFANSAVSIEGKGIEYGSGKITLLESFDEAKITFASEAGTLELTLENYTAPEKPVVPDDDDGFSYRFFTEEATIAAILESVGIVSSYYNIVSVGEGVAVDENTLTVDGNFDRVTLTVSLADETTVEIILTNPAPLPANEQVVVDGVGAFTPDTAVPAGTVLSVSAAEPAEEEAAAVEAKVAETLGEDAQEIHYYDISLVGPQNEEIHTGATITAKVDIALPTEEGKVTKVTDVKVFHVTEDGVEALDADWTLGEGVISSVSFTTEGFSIFGISYTVDFVVNGVQYSMPGSGMLLLSELFEALGIEENVTDIVRVSFTAPNLLDVRKIEENTTYYQLYLERFNTVSDDDDAIIEGSTVSFDVPVYAGDYILTSLSSFDTEETLEIEMLEGRTITIKVTDPQNGSGEWDLAQDVTVTGTEGNYTLVIGSNANVSDLSASVSSTVTSTDQERDISLKINLEYTLNSTALAELKAYTDGYPTLTYDLSTWLQNAPVDIDPTSGKIRQGNNTVGNYTVDANGKVTLTITNLFWLRQQTTLKGVVTINVDLNETKLGNEDDWTIHLPATDETITINFKKPDYNTKKTVSYNGQPNYNGPGVFITPETIDGVEYYILNYTVEMTNPSDKDYLTFSDTITGNQKFYGDVTVTGPNNFSMPYTPDANSQTMSFNIHDNDNNDAVAGTYTVTYKTRIPVSEVRPYYDPTNPDAEPTWEGNSAKWKVNGGSDIPAPTTSVQPANPTPTPAPTPRPGEPTVEKVVGTSEYGHGQESLATQQPETKLYYEISYGETETSTNYATIMAGATISDRMTDNQKLVAGSVEISYDGGNTWSLMPSTGAWDGGVTYYDDNYYSNGDTEVFRFKLPDTAVAPVKVRYQTVIISSAEAQNANLWNGSDVRNTAEFGNNSDMTTVPVDFPDEPELTKTANGHTATKGQSVDAGDVANSGTITYTLTYGSADVSLNGVTIKDTMSTLQHFSGGITITFSDNMTLSLPAEAIKWNDSNVPAVGEQTLFEYTFANDLNKNGPITITYTTTAISATEAHDSLPNVYGNQNVTNKFEVDNTSAITTVHVPTNEPTVVNKTVNGQESVTAEPGETVNYTVVFGKANENMSGYTLYDQMTDIQKLTSDIVLTDNSNPANTATIPKTWIDENWSSISDDNFSTNMVDVLMTIDKQVGWVVPEGWVGPITMSYTAQMADKDTLNRNQLWNNQYANNHAWTDRGGDDWTTVTTDYGEKPIPGIDKVGEVIEGTAENGNYAPESLVKWTITYGGSDDILNGQALSDTLDYLQELVRDETHKVMLYYGTPENNTSSVELTESNGLTYSSSYTVSQHQYGEYTDVQVFYYTVPNEGTVITGPITVVYYTRIISQSDAWNANIEGIKRVGNTAYLPDNSKTYDIPVDFGDKPGPEKKAYVGTSIEDAADQSDSHTSGESYALHNGETGSYVTYYMSYPEESNPVAFSLDGIWVEDYMTDTQDLVSDVEYKVGNGEWRALAVASNASVGEGGGVYWYALHNGELDASYEPTASRSYSTTNKCVFAYRFPAGTGNGPVTFRYTVRMMTNEQTLANGLVNQTAVDNTFKIDNQQAEHRGYVTPAIPTPTKTVNGDTTHTSAVAGTGDTQGTQLDYVLTYGANGQWMNKSGAQATIYDKMTNLQTLDIFSDNGNEKPFVLVTYYTDAARTSTASFVLPREQNGVRWNKPGDSNYSTAMVDVFNYTFPVAGSTVKGWNGTTAADTIIGEIYGPVTVTYSTHIISENQAKNSQVFGEQSVDNSFMDVANTTGTVPFPDNFTHDGNVMKSGFVDENGNPYFGTGYATGENLEAGVEPNIVRNERKVYWTIKIDIDRTEGRNNAFPLKNVWVQDHGFSYLEINGVSNQDYKLDAQKWIDYSKVTVRTESGRILTPGIDYTTELITRGEKDTDIKWAFPTIDEPTYIEFASEFDQTFAGYNKFTNDYNWQVDNGSNNNNTAIVEKRYSDVVVNKYGSFDPATKLIHWTILLNVSAAEIDGEAVDGVIPPLMFEDNLPAGQKLVLKTNDYGDSYFIRVTHKTSVPGASGVAWGSYGNTELLITDQSIMTRESSSNFLNEASVGAGQLHTQYLTSSSLPGDSITSDFKADISMYQINGGTNEGRQGLSRNCYQIDYYTTFTEAGWDALTSDEDGKQTLDNEAFFKEGNHSWSGEGSTTVVVENPLSKLELQDSEKQVGDQTIAVAGAEITDKNATLDSQWYWYRIRINPNRAQLTKDGTTLMKLSDYIDTNIDIVQETAKVYEVDAGDENTPDNWHHVSTGDTENRPVIRYNDDARMLVVENLKDRTYYIIEYRVRLRAAISGENETAYTVTNTASLEAANTWSGSTTSTHKVTSTSATMDGTLTMKKVDENDMTKLLPGASFLLYRQPTMVGGVVSSATDRGTPGKVVNENYDSSSIKNLDGGYNGNPIFLGKFTSDSNGIVNLNSPDADSEEYGTVHDELGAGGMFSPYVLYYWVELTPPTGYLPNPDPHYVVLYDGTSVQSNNVAWELNLLWEKTNHITVATMSMGTDWIITNSKTRAIGVTKRWDSDSDFNNLYKTRPDKIKVNLIQIDEEGNRSVYKTTTLSVNKDGVWDNYTNYLWTNLPATYVVDGETHFYSYTVEEVGVTGYIASYSDNQEGLDTTGMITVWNTLIPTKVDLNLEKKWMDGDGNALDPATLPSSITVTLMQILTDADGNVGQPQPATGIPGYVATITPTTVEGQVKWTHVWEDLPTKDGLGGTYTYTLVEEPIEGYTVTYSDGNRGVLEKTADDPYLVTNTAVGKLNIVKTITGMSAEKQSSLTAEEKRAIKFTVWRVADSEDSTKDVKVASFTYADMQNGVKAFDNMPIGTYRVTEEIVAPALERLQGYNWKSVTFTVGAQTTTATSATENTSPNVTVANGTTGYVTVVNEYEYATGNLTITKAVQGGVTGKTFKIKVQDSEGNYWVPGEPDAVMVVKEDGETDEAFEARKWVTFTANQSRTWTNIPVGAVVITEDPESAAEVGKVWTVTGTENVTVESQQTTIATVTNRYEDENIDLSATKTWTMHEDMYGVAVNTAAEITVGLFKRERKIASEYVTLATPGAWSGEWPEDYTALLPDGITKVGDDETIRYDTTEETWTTVNWNNQPRYRVVDSAAGEDAVGDIYEIEYRVVELSATGINTTDYVTTVTPETATASTAVVVNNEYVPQNTNLTVVKEWSDGNANHSGESVQVKIVKLYGIRTDTMNITVDANHFVDSVNGAAASPAGSIAVTVTGSDGSTYSRTLNETNGWTYIFTDLPKERATTSATAYEPITYSVAYTANSPISNVAVSGATSSISDTSTVTLTSTVPYVAQSKNVPVSLTWHTGGKTLPSDAVVTMTVGGETHTYNASAFTRSGSDYVLTGTIPLTDGQTYTATFTWSGTGYASDGTSSTEITVPQSSSATIPTISGEGTISLITVTVNVNGTWLKGDGTKTTTTLPEGGSITVSFSGLSDTVVVSGPSWTGQTIYLPAGSYTPSVAVSNSNDGEITAATILPSTAFNSDTTLTVQGTVKESNKVRISFANGVGMFTVNDLAELDSAPGEHGAEGNGTTVSWSTNSVMMQNGGAVEAEGLTNGKWYRFTLNNTTAPNSITKSGSSIPIIYGVYYFQADSGTTNLVANYTAMTPGIYVLGQNGDTTSYGSKSITDENWNTGDSIKVTFTVGSWAQPGEWSASTGQSGTFEQAPAEAYTRDVMFTLPASKVIYVTVSSPGAISSISGEKVNTSSSLNSTHLVEANVTYVPASDLTTRKASFWDLFLGTAYADNMVEVVNQPVGYLEVSGLPDSQLTTVTLNAGNGWAHTWTNLPTTEEVDGVIRQVYYYVVETPIPSNVPRVTYTEGSEDAEGRVYRITVTNTVPEKGSLTINKTVLKNTETDTTNNGTYYFGVYASPYTSGDTAVATGSITVSGGVGSTTINDLDLGDYVVYELTGQGGTPITSRGAAFGDKYYAVTASGNPATVQSGSTASVSVTNTYETTEATIEKVWTGDTSLTHKRPGSLTMTLSNGQTVTLSDTNNWCDTITDLPKYDASGATISYTWTEPTVAGYTLASNTPNGTVTTITNTLQTGNLSVTKTVGTGGNQTMAFSFTVQLGDASINGTFGGMTFTNGEASFTLQHGQTVTATGLPVGTSYTVTETTPAGYSATYSGATGTIPADGTAQATVTNNYSSSGTVPFKAKKTLVGGTLGADFTFTLTETDSSWQPLTSGGVSQSVTNNAPVDPATYGDVTFTDVTLTDTTTRYFVIKETIPSPADSSIIYDETEQHITVTVTDDGAGNLTATKAYTVTPETGYDASFTNTKKGALSITKAVTVNGAAWSDSAHVSPADGTYTFTVSDSTSTVVKYVQITVTNGQAESYKVAEANTEEAWTAATPNNGSPAIVSGLAEGSYVISELAPDNTATLEAAARGDRDSSAVSSKKTVTVVVTAGVDTPQEDSNAAAIFTNNIMVQPAVKKTVWDINDSTGVDSIQENGEKTYNDTADHDMGDDIKYRVECPIPGNPLAEGVSSYPFTLHDNMNGLKYKSGRMYFVVMHANGQSEYYDVTTSFSMPAEGTSNLTISPSVTGGLAGINSGYLVGDIDPHQLRQDRGEKSFATPVGEGTPYTFVATDKLTRVEFRYLAEFDNPTFGSGGNLNVTWFNYGADGESSHDYNRVFTYKLQVNKTDGTNPLPGATFSLYKDTTGKPVDQEERVWTLVSTIASTETAPVTTFTWEGIDDGYYKLVETPPTGYQPVPDILFNILADHEKDAADNANPKLSNMNGTRATTDGYTATVDMATGVITIKTTGSNSEGIVNERSVDIPVTKVWGGAATADKVKWILYKLTRKIDDVEDDGFNKSHYVCIHAIDKSNVPSSLTNEGTEANVYVKYSDNENSWNYTWEDLPKYGTIGSVQGQYTYKAHEIKFKYDPYDPITVDDNNTVAADFNMWTVTQDGNTITNTLAYVDIEVNKAWEPVTTWPSDVQSVTVQLQKSEFDYEEEEYSDYENVDGKTLTITSENSVVTAETVAQADDSEKAAKQALLDQRFFRNLPKYDIAGHEIKYRVVETAVSGTNASLADFTVSYNSVETTTGGVIMVTNTVKPISLKVIKVEKGTSTKLPSAEFQLTRSVNGTYSVFENDQFTESAETNKKTGPFSVGSEGEITITNLLPGDYKLSETKAPAGYIITTGEIDFTINVDGTVTVTGRTADSNGNITYTDTNNMVTFAQKTASAAASVTVQNEPGVALPATGGPGTVIYTAAGLSMMSIALWMLLRRRKEQQN